MVKKKKILHIIQSLDRGGCENFLLRVLPKMDEDLEQRILTLSQKGGLAKDFEAVGIRVERTSCFNVLKKIREFDPGVVVTYLFRADVVGRLMIQPLTKYRVIPFLRTNYNYPRYWLPRLFERLTSFAVRQYLVNSNSVKSYLKGFGVSVKKITVVPNGLDMRVFENARKQRPKTRRSLGLTDKEVVICCVANFHSHKGHVYLLKAFEEVYKKYKNVRLLLVGDGKERFKMEKLVVSFESRQKIKFLGMREDVPLVLAASDIFAMVTFFEGMSNAIMEAMASGLPVVTTDIPENKELIKNRVTGLLVKKKNVASLEKAITSLTDHSVKRLGIGKKSASFIEKNYDINKIAKKLFLYLSSHESQ